MIDEETLNKVLDIIKGILGVKSQNAQIMLTSDGKIIFRHDKVVLYCIQTDLFTIIQDTYITFSSPIVLLDKMTAMDLTTVYDYCTKPIPLLVRYENVQEDENFLNLTTLKSKDGIGYYQMFDNQHNVYRIPMYTGFVKFNKGDQADIEVYDDGPYFLNKFIVRKKKINYPIQIYFLTLKLK